MAPLALTVEPSAANPAPPLRQPQSVREMADDHANWVATECVVSYGGRIGEGRPLIGGLIARFVVVAPA